LIACHDLIESLRTAKVSPGSTLVFEAPKLETQQVQGGFSELLQALQKLLAGGLLVVPTCSPTEGRPKKTFDPALSPSEMGPFSEFFRRQPGVLRSHNATHSAAALGPSAGALVGGHRSACGRPTPWGDSAFGKGSPWDLLNERDACWLMIDSCWEKSPFIAFLRTMYSQLNSGITKRTPFVSFDSRALVARLRSCHLVEEFKSGDQRLEIFRMKETVDSALAIIRDQLVELYPDSETQNWLDRIARIKEHGYLEAGVAKRAITPRTPCIRWDGKRLSGVHRDLYSRVLVLSYQGFTVVLVVCDLLGLRKELVDAIRQRAYQLTGISPDAIQIACTHAHSTPDTCGAGYEDEAYLQLLVEASAEGISEAAGCKRSARMGWAQVPIRGLAASRRIRLTDGTVFTTRYSVPSTWRVDPDHIASKGRIDPDLTVIRFEDLDGRILAAVSNFGCHTSVALASPYVSGDFFGESMATLERVLGEPAVALCTNGAAADVDPTLEMPFWGPRDDASALRLGNIFAAQVLECLERVEVRDESVVRSLRLPVDLPVRPEWIRLLSEERERMRQEFAGSSSLCPAIVSALREKVIHTEIQALRLSDLILVGFPGEVFTDTALRLKSEVRKQSVAVVELANDMVGYLAPARAFKEGGYEVGVHFWGRVTPDAETLLLAEAVAAVKGLTS
jgi:neutral ceramidase